MPDKKDIPNGSLNPKGIQNPPHREFRVHRNVGPDEVFVACGKNIEGKGSCWLCDTKIPELEATGSAEKIRMAQLIQPQEQFMVQASRYDSDTHKFSMPKAWWVSTGSGIPGRQSQSLAVRVFSKIASSKRDYIDPVKGYNLNIERTGMGIKTRYPSIDSDESPTKVPVDVLQAVKDIDTLVPKYSEEDQKNAYFGRARSNGRESLRSKPRGGAARPVADVEEESNGSSDSNIEAADTEPVETNGEEPEAETEAEAEVETEELDTEYEAEPVEEPEESEEVSEEEIEESEIEEEEPPPPPPSKKKAPAAPVKAAPAPIKKAAAPSKKR